MFYFVYIAFGSTCIHMYVCATVDTLMTLHNIAGHTILIRINFQAIGLALTAQLL